MLFELQLKLKLLCNENIFPFRRVDHETLSSSKYISRLDFQEYDDWGSLTGEAAFVHNHSSSHQHTVHWHLVGEVCGNFNQVPWH